MSYLEEIKFSMRDCILKLLWAKDGDLIVALEGMISFSETLERKIKAAQTKGLIYIDAVTGKPQLT